MQDMLLRLSCVLEQTIEELPRTNQQDRILGSNTYLSLQSKPFTRKMQTLALTDIRVIHPSSYSLSTNKIWYQRFIA